MNIQTHDSPLGLHIIGEAALSVLSDAQNGSVLASVTNAVYMLSEQGDLCWLIPMDSPMHQRAMQVTTPIPRLNVGSLYEVVDHSLITSSGDVLDFHQAAIWVSPTISSNQIVSISRLSETLTVVADRLLAHHMPSGLGSLITPILQFTTEQSKALEVRLTNGITGKAWLVIQEIIQASLVNDTDLMIDSAKSLIGLGEGLTPSGDDFLGGFIFSRQLFDHHFKNVLNLPIWNYLDFILQSKLRTNLISYTLLTDHAEGHSVEPLHQFTNGLLMGESVDQLYLNVEKLICLGHSTGWDLLSGFLAGMSVTFAQYHSM